MDHSLKPGIDRPIRVVIADADCRFRASLRQLLSVPPTVVADVYGVDAGAGFRVVGEAETCDGTLARVAAMTPDLLLLDVRLPPLSGIRTLRRLASGSTVRTILLPDTIERADLADALSLGVRGVVLKSAAAELLFEAIAGVMAGRYWLDPRLVSGLIEIAREAIQSSPAAPTAPEWRLTRREREILRLLVAGYGNKEIAEAFGIGEDTIKHHLTRMYAKSGASNRLALAMAATARGLVDAPSPSAPDGASDDADAPGACYPH